MNEGEPTVDLQDLRDRYRGNRARNYDADRANQPEWQAEHEVIQDLISRLASEASVVLDVPVGTGRFLTLYREVGCRVVGLDASEDMLAQATEAAAGLSMDDIELRVGDITSLDLPDGSVDVALAIRIANMLELPDLSRAVEELSRTSRQHVILGLQIYTPRGVIEAARRRKRDRARRTVTKPHPAKPVERMFRRSGLHEASRVPIRHDKDSSYFIFHLTKELL